MTHESRIALLIDADNSPAGKIDEILDELAKEGVINIRRAYGDWKSPHLKAWETVLHEYAIQPMQQFAYTKGKNATDSAMIIDAMDLLYTKQLDGFCIVSSDSDFTPLVMRIRANGLKVFGFGEKKTPSPFVNACSRFLYLENLGMQAEPGVKLTAVVADNGNAPALAPKTVAAKLSAKELKSDTRLVSLLRKAIEASADDEGWANLSGVGSHISKQASFDSRNYGYAKLKDLYLGIGLFDMQTKNKVVYVRDKKLAQRPAAAIAQ